LARPPHVRLLLPSFAPCDAVGNDVLGMAAALTDAGYPVEIFAGAVHPALGHLASPLSAGREGFRRGGDLLIYHHSTGWPEGEAVLASTRNTCVVRYHNVTPPGFLARYSELHAGLCARGREATAALALTPGALFWGDSGYNCDELIRAGAPRARCRILPPFHRIEELAAEPFDPALLGRSRGDRTATVLFVGGFRPNKGHLRAIAAFAAYHHGSNPRSRLVLAGSLESAFRGYFEDLRAFATELGLARRVVFAPSASAAQLRSWYLLSSVFLCLSEHEGFCVPLVEAMYFRVPIVAWETTAVPETLGGCALASRDYAEVLFAAAIDRCIGEPPLARGLRRMGRLRYESAFRPEILQARLLDLVHEAVRGPAHLPQPADAFPAPAGNGSVRWAT
jgi:glycosyltransferase involved in cell wall biosynthesis